MSIDFVALDFETANAFRGSPCAVGVTKVQGGRIVDCRSMLMRPPASVDYFSPWNVMIHGITPEAVKDRPRFGDLWPQLVDYIGDFPVVAHNAAFDLGVVREACIESGLPWPRLTYGCTLVLGRRTYDLLSYSLPFVADAAGLQRFDHHDAGEDSRITASVLLDIARHHQATSLPHVFQTVDVLWGQLDPEMWSGCRRRSGGSARPPEANPDADAAHPLFGQVVVFTGAMQTMTRGVAWERVAFVGGRPERTPTKRTTILVEGLQDPTRLRPGMPLSTKAEKARTLRQKGYPIELMGEPEFLAMLADDRGGGFRADVVDHDRFDAWLAVQSRA